MEIPDLYFMKLHGKLSMETFHGNSMEGFPWNFMGKNMKTQ